MRKIPIEVSARHIHLSEADKKVLFGGGYQLTVAHYISEPRNFLCRERVDLYTPHGQIERVGIVGPVRKYTQIEMTKTDAYRLGLASVPVRASGELELAGTPGICVKNSVGEICVRQGVIISWRHLHLNHGEALELNLADGDIVKIRVGGVRAVVFENVLVRVRPDFQMAMHVDTDEANAAGVTRGTWGELVR